MPKPIHLYSHKTGPNPWKVAIILEELGLPYETEFVPIDQLHTPVYEKINPNGRVPAIYDPNTDLTLWESGAIINYLVNRYDDTKKLQPPDSIEGHAHAQQWLFFQVSGQGPYFGQFTWFSNFHPEKVPSAIERYANEIKRVTKVLDTALQGKEYLVGGKCTYADLAFVTWNAGLERVPDLYQQLKEDNANWKAWVERIGARDAVKKVLGEKAKIVAEMMAQKK